MPEVFFTNHGAKRCLQRGIDGAAIEARVLAAYRKLPHGIPKFKVRYGSDEIVIGVNGDRLMVITVVKHKARNESRRKRRLKKQS